MGTSVIAVAAQALDGDKALKQGQKAMGAALATEFLRTMEDQAGKLKRFLQNIFDLSHEGRKAFRHEIAAFIKIRRDEVKQWEGQPEYEMLNRTLRSAVVRASEAKTYSLAIDAGFVPNMTQGSYHSIVVEARMFKQAGAAGPEQKRGRKAKTKLQKFADYVVKVEPSLKELRQMDELLNTWIKDRARPAKAKVEAKPAAKEEPVKAEGEALKVLPSEMEALKNVHPKHRHPAPPAQH